MPDDTKRTIEGAAEDLVTYVFNGLTKSYDLGVEFVDNLLEVCRDFYRRDQPFLHYAEVTGLIDYKTGFQEFWLRWKVNNRPVVQLTAEETAALTEDEKKGGRKDMDGAKVSARPVYAFMCSGFHGKNIRTELFTWNYPKDVVPPFYSCPAFENGMPHDTYHAHVYRPGMQVCDFDFMGPIPGDNVLLFHGGDMWVVLDYVMNDARAVDTMRYDRDIKFPKDWVLRKFKRK
jgi:hypothetical protein